MTEESTLKWEGKAMAELPDTDPQFTWNVFEDFCNLHKWIPIETCYQVEGVSGQPGLIRYCANSTVEEEEGVGDDAQKTTTIKWAKEKLLQIDPVQRCLTYEVGENNIGFKSYVATIKVFPINHHRGSKIEWSFVCDPVQGWTFQDLNSIIESYVEIVAKKIVLACNTN
ncbi:lachrymatory-factor synthase-like [Vigna unguiculata]|uniref:Polyketide cyclase/dehydrase n=1 Tax=Vigna unguiculata TaxID=3917 RepID=A0A4D6NQ79_VIGUN|nr:lachrymatory-factor synthase-like [Vigna unguiculata]QCE16050.1 hypothetical protein DEO72_LG11g3063 [Vigna unguiculata]